VQPAEFRDRLVDCLFCCRGVGDIGTDGQGTVRAAKRAHFGRALCQPGIVDVEERHPRPGAHECHGHSMAEANRAGRAGNDRHFPL
jgi:hypothetical protein